MPTTTTGNANAAATVKGVVAWTGYNPPADRLVRPVSPWHQHRHRSDLREVQAEQDSGEAFFWQRRKRPDEVLDYYFDVGPLIEPLRAGELEPQETITSLTASVVEGAATLTSQAAIGGMLQIFVAAGTPHEHIKIEAILMTSRGRTYTMLSRLRVGY